MQIKLTSLQAEELFHMTTVRTETIDDDMESASTFETVETLDILSRKIQAAVVSPQEFNELEVEWMRDELDTLTDAAKHNADNGDAKEGGRYRSLLALFNKIS